MKLFVVTHVSASYDGLNPMEPFVFKTEDEEKKVIEKAADEAEKNEEGEVEYYDLGPLRTSLTITYKSDVIEAYRLDQADCDL